MPVSVIVGGQFGSEGKGKVAQYSAAARNARIAIRVGGPNSGHTATYPDGTSVIFRQLPAPAVLPNVICVVGAGSLIDPQLLLYEAKHVGLTPDRLYIDSNATLIGEEDKEEERRSGLRDSIGSTLSGTGSALRRRLRRDSNLRTVGDEPALEGFVRSSTIIRNMLRTSLERKERILVEGTQGFGLSVLHSPYYPFVTSRDTTAATFVAEAGLSPVDVDEIILVLRAFPIRVGGNSGPLPHEVDWSTITRESGSQDALIEFTSVTQTIRRVGRFDPDIVKLAIAVNQPTQIVMNHLDYLDSKGSKQGHITAPIADFIASVEEALEQRIDLVGLGPSVLKRNTRSPHRASSRAAVTVSSVQ